MRHAPDIICIGAAHWDVIGQSPATVAPGSDMPGVVYRAPGGVALNIAAGLVANGLRAALIAAVGTDAAGVELCGWAEAAGVDTALLIRTAGTDCYLAIEGPEGLIAAIAESAMLESIGPEVLSQLPADETTTVLLDSGLSATTLATLAAGITTSDLRLAAASPAKVARLAPFLARDACFYLNRAEAEAICATGFPDSTSAARALRAKGAARAIVTDGPNPVCDASADGVITATPPALSPRRVTGAGDHFTAAHIAAECRGQGRHAALHTALAAAAAHISSQP